MPRFYFHLAGLIEDNRGVRCPTRVDAREIAESLAADYGASRRAGDARCQYICVNDEMGTEVFRTPVLPH
jgi:hypothetical protein